MISYLSFMAMCCGELNRLPKNENCGLHCWKKHLPGQLRSSWDLYADAITATAGATTITTTTNPTATTATATAAAAIGPTI